MSTFYEIFHGEQGINARYRDNDFGLDETEIIIIKEYVDRILEDIKNYQKISPDDFSDFILLVSDLKKACYSGVAETGVKELHNYILFRSEIIRTIDWQS